MKSTELVLMGFISITIAGGIGCNNAEDVAPPQTQTPADAQRAMITQATRDYWDRCLIVNRNYVHDKQDLWFGEFRPSDVAKNCRDAAATLRLLDRTNVDPEVLDHTNRVIRGFETIGSIAETKGRQVLLQDAADTLKFIAMLAKKNTRGAVADSGSLAIGTGIFENGQKTSEEGYRQTTAIGSQLMASEEKAIRHVRQTYGIELAPW